MPLPLLLSCHFHSHFCTPAPQVSFHFIKISFPSATGLLHELFLLTGQCFLLFLLKNCFILSFRQISSNVSSPGKHPPFRASSSMIHSCSNWFPFLQSTYLDFHNICLHVIILAKNLSPSSECKLHSTG